MPSSDKLKSTWHKMYPVGIFDTKDFDTDGTHYKTQGILDMGSCFAEEMAKLSGISSKFVYGDVNGDGVLNSDYAEIKLILLEITDSLKYTNGKKQQMLMVMELLIQGMRFNTKTNIRGN